MGQEAWYEYGGSLTFGIMQIVEAAELLFR
jgi:hypothetical protein